MIFSLNSMLNWTYDREQVRLQRDCDLPCVIEGLLCHSDLGDCFSGSGFTTQFIQSLETSTCLETLKSFFPYPSVFFCLSFAQLSSPFSYLLQFKSCLSISGSQLLHCCALSPIFYLIFFISSLLVGLLGFCFSFCDGCSSSLDICCAGCAGTFFFFRLCSFSVHLQFSEQNMSMHLIGDACMICFRDLGQLIMIDL